MPRETTDRGTDDGATVTVPTALMAELVKRPMIAAEVHATSMAFKPKLNRVRIASASRPHISAA